MTPVDDVVEEEDNRDADSTSTPPPPPSTNAPAPAPVPCPPELVAFANRLADASGEVIRRYFRTSFAVDDKKDSSPVTIADREAELALRRLIEAEHPTHGIIGEEFESVRADADWVWVLDPIDGTKSFITGRAEFGTLIALLFQGRAVLGVIDQPIAGERWVGANGAPEGTTFNGRPSRVRSCKSLDQAILHTTSPHLFSPDEFVAFERVRKVVKTPLYGCDCYAYGLVSSGYVDLVIEAGLKLHDYSALEPVVRNAGGVMTDWKGEALGLKSSGNVVAAGDTQAHQEAIRLLNGGAANVHSCSNSNEQMPSQAGQGCIESMTGFGSAEGTRDGVRVQVFVKSVNGRTLEMKVQMAKGYEELESKIRNLIRDKLGRGSVSVSVQISQVESSFSTKRAQSAKVYSDMLDEMARAASVVSGGIRMEHILEAMRLFPSLVPDDRSAAVADEVWTSAVKPVVEEALDKAVGARMVEGEALAKDMRECLGRMSALLAQVEERAPVRLQDAKALLRSKVTTLLSDDQRLDPSRLEMEVALLLTRLDVTEECVRLRSLLSMFAANIESPPHEPSGHRFQFLIQELVREVNTIGSKASDTIITQKVIAMKEETEKLRQQAMNIK